jgi:Asp-tRNA(Asn)/Glu-tRNA(Gln) amidotransferase B subunit
VAKAVLAEMVDGGGDPRQIIADRGLAQVSDEDALAAIVDHVVAANPDKADDYRAGKTALFGFFVGQVMRASQGRANPQVVQKLLTDRLAAR